MTACFTRVRRWLSRGQKHLTRSTDTQRVPGNPTDLVRSSQQRILGMHVQWNCRLRRKVQRLLKKKKLKSQRTIDYKGDSHLSIWDRGNWLVHVWQPRIPNFGRQLQWVFSFSSTTPNFMRVIFVVILSKLEFDNGLQYSLQEFRRFAA